MPLATLVTPTLMVPADAVMAELFGRVDGCAHGRGGSMHLLDVSVGYYGGWGIVAGQLPIEHRPVGV